MTKLVAIGPAIACLLIAFAPAQEKQENTSNNAIARYVMIEDAQIAVGKQATNANVTAQIRDIANSTAPDLNWIAGEPNTGDSDHVTYVYFYDSMASVEKGGDALAKAAQALVAKNPSILSQAGDMLKGYHLTLAEYNKELSYRPDAVPMAETKWWYTSTYELKRGCNEGWAEIVKSFSEMAKRANWDTHGIAYNVRAGAPEPTILFVRPMRSLAEMDQEPPAAAMEAFASAPWRQMLQQFADKGCILHEEHSYTRVDPGLSRPAQSVVAANPDFWTPKPEPAVASAKPAKQK
jgi:hypothetical protein